MIRAFGPHFVTSMVALDVLRWVSVDNRWAGSGRAVPVHPGPRVVHHGRGATSTATPPNAVVRSPTGACSGR